MDKSSKKHKRSHVAEDEVDDQTGEGTSRTFDSGHSDKPSTSSSSASGPKKDVDGSTEKGVWSQPVQISEEKSRFVYKIKLETRT